MEKKTDTTRPEFITAFHFAVTFISADGPVSVPFQSVTGISSTLKTETVAEGGENRFMHTIPSPGTHENLKLTRALTTADSVKAQKEIIQWAENALYNFRITRKTVLVSILNSEHLPVRNWVFEDAYPVKMSINSLDAKKDELAIETLELAYKFMKSISLD